MTVTPGTLARLSATDKRGRYLGRITAVISFISTVSSDENDDCELPKVQRQRYSICIRLPRTCAVNCLKRKPRDSLVAGASFINLPCASLMLLEVASVANLVRKRRFCKRESRLHYFATRRRGFEVRFLFRWCS